MQSEFPASVTITNMSSEMFNDALFYMELGDDENNNFIKRRFYRASIIFFCISVEAWINKLLANALMKKTNMSKNDEKLYKVLTEELEIMPSGINLSIHAKFNIHLCNLYNFKINKDSSLDRVIEKYIKITNYRNKIIHYSDGSYKKAYDILELEKCIKNSPDIIEVLFDELNNISSIAELGYPSWFKEKKSRQI